LNYVCHLSKRSQPSCDCEISPPIVAWNCWWRCSVQVSAGALNNLKRQGMAKLLATHLVSDEGDAALCSPQARASRVSYHPWITVSWGRKSLTRWRGWCDADMPTLLGRADLMNRVNSGHYSECCSVCLGARQFYLIKGQSV